MKRLHLAASAVFICFALLTGAAQAGNGYVRTPVHMRAGPGTGYPVFNIIYPNEIVEVFSCIAGWQWCEVENAGTRGWISGRYLQVPEYGPMVQYGSNIGVPIIIFDQNTYWDRYYTDRPFYRDWYSHHPRQQIIRYEQPRRPVVIRQPVRFDHDDMPHRGMDHGNGPRDYQGHDQRNNDHRGSRDDRGGGRGNSRR